MKFMKQNTINFSSSEEVDGFENKENRGPLKLKLRFSMIRENKEFLKENSTV